MSSPVRSMLLLFVAIVFIAPLAQAQLPPPPSPPRETFAGEPYSESFRIDCVAPGTALIRVDVSPPAFTATVNPSRVTPGQTVTLSATIPIDTPAQRYRITLNGIATGGSCQSGSETILLTVKRPIRLDVNPTRQMITSTAPANYSITIRRTPSATQNVTLRTSGLPDGFTAQFNPPSTAGRGSTLSIQKTQTAIATTSCGPPDGCVFQVRGEAGGVQVEPFDARLIVSAPGPAATSIMVSPPLLTSIPGLPVEYQIKTTVANGDTLSSLNATVNPAGPVTAAPDPFDTRRLIVNTAGAPAGRYQITVTGSVVPAGGGSVRPVSSNTVELVLLAAGVMLETNPTTTILIDQGRIERASVKITPRGGFTGPVMLATNPSQAGGVVARFSNGNNSVTITSPQQVATLNIDLDATNAPPGDAFFVEVTSSVPANVPKIRYRVIPRQAARINFTRFSATGIPPSGFRNGGAIQSGDKFLLEYEVTQAGTCEAEAFDNSFRLEPAEVLRFDVPLDPRAKSGAIPITANTVMADTNFTLVIVGNAPPCIPEEKVITGKVVPRPPMPPPPPVSATLTPASQTIMRGQSTSYTFTISRGAQGPLALAVSGLPPGVTAAATPNPITGDSAQVTLTTSANAPAGTFGFTVNATSNGASVASANASLTITAPPPPPGAPAISSFTPSSGMAGTQVQIFGTNLMNVQNVIFSNNAGAAFSPISSTQVNATVPGLAVTGPIRVITAGGTAMSGASFIVAPSSQAPQITGFTPSSGPAGTSVRLQGVNLGGVFDVSLGTPALGFNPVPFTPIDSSRIDVIIPAAVQSGFFRASTPGGTAISPAGFLVTTPNLPEIGGFNPISGPPGTRVEIIGSNLGGTSLVTFAGISASFETPQANRVFAIVPPNARSGQIGITTPNGAATSFGSFAVTSGGPVITDFQPRAGAPGTSVTIAGANLSGVTEVTFNGTRAQIGIVTNNFVQVFVPNGATTGLVRLRTPGGTAASQTSFTVQ